MPFGYLVSLGDAALNTGDGISGGYTSFTTDHVIGSGHWTWTGTIDNKSCTDQVETGSYALGTDGCVYFTPDLGPVDSLSSGCATNPPSYGSADGVVDGTAASDYIHSTYTDADGDQMNDGIGSGPAGNGDTVLAGAGNDTVNGGCGDDSISGGTGNDVLSGHDGDDTLDGGAGADRLHGGKGLDYADYSDSDEAVNVNLTTETGSGGEAEGDTYSGVDGVLGSSHNDTIIGFNQEDSDPHDTYTNDFHGGAGDDYLDGKGGNDSLYGDTGDDTLIGGSGDDKLSGGDGADRLIGGTGHDTMSGGRGDDHFEVSEGDVASGGDDKDTFRLTDLGESGRADISVDGEEGGKDWDTLDLGGLVDRTTLDVTSTSDGTMSGTATMLDGSSLKFSNIENIICFVAGTRISTVNGAVPIEELVPGDLVLTRDNGFQPVQWLGSTTVPAHGHWAPIRIEAGTLGTSRDLLVSPQHRMLLTDANARFLFGSSEVLSAARFLINDHSIRRQPCGMVTYMHLLLNQHEVIFAEDCPSESFFPGDQALEALSGAALYSLFNCMPHLRDHPEGFGPTARYCLNRPETLALRA